MAERCLMKRTLFLIAASISLALSASASYGADVSNYPAGAVANGIGGSRHNLGDTSRVLYTDATTEICVFCHTPHHTNTGGSTGLAPLWNKATSAPTAFTAYGTTLGGTLVSNTDLGGATLACLSCHDGVATSSFDNIVNAPGKGGVTPGGTDRGWGFGMPLRIFAPNALFDHFDTGFPCSMCHNSASSATMNNSIQRLMIERDLSNDHPVSVPYNADRASLRATDTVINSIDLTSGLAASATTYNSSNLAQNRWAIKGFISNTATISDLLRNGRVECSSCHDPHFRNHSWDEAEASWTNPTTPLMWCDNDPEKCSDGNFLRRVCRTCHNK